MTIDGTDFNDYDFKGISDFTPFNKFQKNIEINTTASYDFITFPTLAENLKKVYKIHELLLIDKNFTIKEKLNFCVEQRQYMKNYLCEIKRKFNILE